MSPRRADGRISRLRPKDSSEITRESLATRHPGESGTAVTGGDRSMVEIYIPTHRLYVVPGDTEGGLLTLTKTEHQMSGIGVLTL